MFAKENLQIENLLTQLVTVTKSLTSAITAQQASADRLEAAVLELAARPVPEAPQLPAINVDFGAANAQLQKILAATKELLHLEQRRERRAGHPVESSLPA